jgi:transcription antitermination factor NusG
MFSELGIDNYCPLNKVKKKWSDRTKMVEEPLFKSYVFVRITEAEQAKVRATVGVVNFVYWLGKPAVIRQFEIDRIKKFLNEYENVKVEQLSLRINDQVIVSTGIFMDRKARVIQFKRNKVELEIESLGYKLIALVDRKIIQKK